MLAIVNLSSQDATFPVRMFQEVDAAFGAIGLKKQVRSVVVPGKTFSVTYEGPSLAKDKLTGILAPIAERNGIAFDVEVEESVSFP
ncbi:MAG TPA: hypothetical protein VLV31_08040 [Candidatus Acidoferrales bacterium]|nr:hypothetical protein [Candidatus Acidoferrales bacterium]